MLEPAVTLVCPYCSIDAATGNTTVTTDSKERLYGKVERTASGDLKLTDLQLPQASDDGDLESIGSDVEGGSLEIRKDGTQISRDLDGHVTRIVHSDGAESFRKAIVKGAGSTPDLEPLILEELAVNPS